MSIVIFDTEFTAWEGSQERSWSFDNEYREIIQVSALKIRKQEDGFLVEDQFSMYIKPRINDTLSKYIIKLTGITQEKIDRYGKDFSVFMDQFYQFSKGHRIYSYGNDYSIIEENIQLYNIKLEDKKWHTMFYDVRDVLEMCGIDTTKYTSGTLYKHYVIESNRKINVHDSYWDVYSIYLTLNHIIKKRINCLDELS